MLIDGRNFWKLHSRWLLGTVVAAALAIAWTLAVAARGGRWPGGGSLSGLVLGILAVLIFVFEMALVAKKSLWFRTARWLPRAQTWMKAHIWLGVLTVPLVVLHSGGRIGGWLTIWLIVSFSIVIVSGIWGLAMQNILPRILLDAVPAETIHSQIDQVGQQYAAQAQRLVLMACGGDEESAVATTSVSMRPGALDQANEHIRGAARHTGLQIKRSPHPARELPQMIASPAIQTALTREVDPYLRVGITQQLGSRQKNQWYFDDLRLRVEPELRELVGQLEELCERRRQLNLQRRIQFWLQNWLWVHLPLSVALLILVAAHIVIALRFG